MTEALHLWLTWNVGLRDEKMFVIFHGQRMNHVQGVMSVQRLERPRVRRTTIILMHDAGKWIKGDE